MVDLRHGDCLSVMKGIADGTYFKIAKKRIEEAEKAVLV